MVEESESESPSDRSTDGEPPESEDRVSSSTADSRESDDAGAEDDESDSDSSADSIPGGSIADHVDDESILRSDERAPMGATGTPDPFEREERESVSDAVGAPVPESELEDDPDIEIDPAVLNDQSAVEDADRSAVEDADRSAVEDADQSVVEDADQSVVEDDNRSPTDTAASEESVIEADAESASVVERDGENVADPSVTADTDGEATTAVDPDAELDDGLIGEGPKSDEELPLADHIEEMVRRLAVVLVLGGVVALAVFPVADQAINFLWNSHIPGAQTITDRRPRLYGPLELLVTELKVSALAGFVVGLPVAVYETYLFMRPGLFPRERRYYLAAVPTSLILALIGVAFAHFVVLPAIFAYFTAYTTGTAVVAFGLKETFSLILILMGYMALVFQIPLFIMLAIMMNLTTRAWLEQRRLLFWGGFLGVAFLISPDPTGMAPIIVAATMITLFEGTLALLRWTGN